MTGYVLHGLWTRAQQLCLWVEEIDGHKVRPLEQLPPNELPPALATQLAKTRSTLRVETTLRSPKGRLPRLPIKVAPLLPQAAVKLLRTIATAPEPSTAADVAALGTSAQWATIGPELRYLAHLVTGLEGCVRAGRICLSLSSVDAQWYPVFALPCGPEEAAFINAMDAAAPAVLAMNFGGPVAESVAGALYHDLVLELLGDQVDLLLAANPHAFTRTLLTSGSVSRGGPQMLGPLNQWRTSLTTVPATLTILVEELHEALGEEAFLLAPRVRLGDGPPLRLEDVQLPGGHGSDEVLALAQRARAVCPLLDSPEIGGAVRPDSRYGDDEAYEAITGEVDNEPSDADRLLTLTQLQEFLHTDVPRLSAAGFPVMLPKTWGKATGKLSMTTQPAGESNTSGVRLGMDEMVEYAFKLDFAGYSLSAEEVTEMLESGRSLVKVRDRWVVADATTMAKCRRFVADLAAASRAALTEALDRAQAALALTTTEEEKAEQRRIIADLEEKLASPESAGHMALKDLHSYLLTLEPDIPLAVDGDGYTDSLLASACGTPPDGVDIPDTVHAELRHYQRRGVAWLDWMSRNHLGAILADDMGLGKTLQVLTLIAVEKARAEDSQESDASGETPGEGTAVHPGELATTVGAGRAATIGRAPTLIVAPTSVIGNWGKEAQRFVPHLRVYTHYGASRKEDDEMREAIATADIVITSYGTLVRDVDTLRTCVFDRVVLDEAQHIKNSGTKVSKAARAIPSRHRLALTGTPVENRLSELRSILDWCNPGMLGSASFFRNRYATAIEKYGDEVQTQKLVALTRPFILRREKSDPTILTDLPDKQEQVVTVDLTAEQAALYRAVTEELLARIAASRSDANGAPVSGAVFTMITAIKQICNHPAHYLGDNSPLLSGGKHRSGKVKALDSIIDAALGRHEKVLVFTQYAAFGQLLKQHLEDITSQEVPFLHGGTSRTARDRMVAEFQQPDGPEVMVLSLKAGGTGLNLTAASHVVHMDRWWNPAVENQATDRAFRIGQTRDVHVYKMVTKGTLEERINDVIMGKTHLANAIIGAGEGWITQLPPEELSELVELREEATAHAEDIAATDTAAPVGETPDWYNPDGPRPTRPSSVLEKLQSNPNLHVVEED